MGVQGLALSKLMRPNARFGRRSGEYQKSLDSLRGRAVFLPNRGGGRSRGRGSVVLLIKLAGAPRETLGWPAKWVFRPKLFAENAIFAVKMREAPSETPVFAQKWAFRSELPAKQNFVLAKNWGSSKRNARFLEILWR